MDKCFFRALGVLTLILQPIAVIADKVSEQQALQIAQQFMKGRNFSIPSKARGTVSRSAGNDGYYVFNAEGNDGFVIVSSDDRTPAVLGYSDSGSFDYDKLPENAKAWMDCYAKQIKSLDNLSGFGNDNEKPVAASRSQVLTKEVKPLLGDLEWGQTDPWNLLCPTDGTEPYLTGCGPTAMAQIMYYYRWPQGYGKGSISYYDEGCQQTHSADFSKSKYDWDKMLPKYTGHYDYQEGKSVFIDDYTDKQALEVAKLMRDCGFSAQAHYDDGATSSHGGRICDALKNIFNYKQTTCLFESTYYDKESWETVIRSELDSKRPVLYDVNVFNVGGHILICDGYDKNGYFHFNWGWGGYANGYYMTTAARGCGDFGEMWCGIQRSIDNGKQMISPHADNDFKWSSGNRFSCALRVWTSVNNIELAIAAENLATGTVQYLSVTQYVPEYNNPSPWVNELTLKETLVDGSYKVYPVARASGQEWEMFHFNQFQTYQEFVLLTVSGGEKPSATMSIKTKYYTTTYGTASTKPPTKQRQQGI